MARPYVNFPVNKEHKPFCDFMEYSLVSESDGFYVYNIPHNHLCRFLINFEKWGQGSFDREAFVELTNI